MTNATSLNKDSVNVLKACESAVVVCGGMALITFVAGVWLGVRAAVATVPGEFDADSHPTLGIGVAIVVLSLAVSVVSAMVAAVLHTYARPRRAVYREQVRRETEQLAAEGL